MLYETELRSRVIVPVEYTKGGGAEIPKSLVMTCLLYQLSMVKATEEIGYFLSVTKILSIEKDGATANNNHVSSSSKCLLSAPRRVAVFHVYFCCRAFMPRKGEIMIGTVYQVLKDGVLMKCGPMNLVYLSSRCMPMYQYVEDQDQDQDPFYLNPDDLSRIQKDVIIRFMVLAFRWNNRESTRRLFEIGPNPTRKQFENDLTRRQFEILATIKGDSLGPISSAGSDAMDF